MRTLLAAALLAASVQALAQAWPARAVRLVVPFPPGGPTDTVARLLGQHLSEKWGQQFVVENRSGASGNLGVSGVAKAAPDGYTVLVASTSIAVNVTLSAQAGYTMRDFTPVVNVASSPNMIVAGPAGAQNLRQLIDAARVSGLVYGSPGSGTTPHLTAEYLFRTLAGLRITHVPYKGAAPAVTAAMMNEVPAVSVAMAAAVPFIKGGKLRGLAVMSAERVSALPDVPTIQESGFPGFEDYTWVGVLVPAGTPREVVVRLNEESNAFLARPQAKERLASLAFEPVGGPPERFAAYLQAEVAKWAKVIRETGAKPE